MQAFDEGSLTKHLLLLNMHYTWLNQTEIPGKIKLGVT
jgi:hypothetical protein